MRHLGFLFWSLVLLGCKTPEFVLDPQENGLLPGNPKNIVLMIGDGMGLTQMSALIYSNGNFAQVERCPIIGLQKTQSFDNLVTDSAGAATAMACGQKTYNSAIGITPDTLPCKTILEEAKERGWSTGMVVTSSIVHATPASFVGHELLRNFHEYIARDMVDKGMVDFMVGGGEKYFSNRRSDNRNLISEMKSKGYFISSFMPTKKSLQKKEKIAWFTAEEEPMTYAEGRRYLPEATGMALDFLSKKKSEGFFLMVEASQIDWAGHHNNEKMLLEELQDFDKTIQVVLDFAKSNQETLVIITGDHESGGLAINRGKKFGKLDLEFTTNGHTASMVPVYAYGPGAGTFGGVYENTAIYEKMKTAFGWQTL